MKTSDHPEYNDGLLHGDLVNDDNPITVRFYVTAMLYSN